MSIDIDSIFNNLIAATIWAFASYLFVSIKQGKFNWLKLNSNNIFQILAYLFVMLIVFQLYSSFGWLPSNDSSFLHDNNINNSGLENFYRIILDVGEVNAGVFLLYILSNFVLKNKEEEDTSIPIMVKILLGNFGLFLALHLAIRTYVSFWSNNLSFWQGLGNFCMLMLGTFLFVASYFLPLDEYK